LGDTIVISSKSEGTVHRSIFTGNVDKSVDALTVTEQSSVVVQVSRFDVNKTLGLRGGVMSVSVSGLELFANRFPGNESPNGVGGALMWGGNTTPIVRMTYELG
jgi:hypothetical protein